MSTLMDSRQKHAGMTRGHEEGMMEEARTKLRTAILIAAKFLAEREAAVKQQDAQAIAGRYRTAFAGAVAAFLISHRNQQTLRDDLRRAITTFLALAFMTGYRQAGGGDVDAADQMWIDARIAAEVAFSAEFAEQLAALNTEEMDEAELRALADRRSALYVATLIAIFNAGLLRGSRNVMLTFDGVDGFESCRDCQRLNGQRHLAKWWIDKNLIPGVPGNPNFECRGYHCEHYLATDDGQPYTERLK